MIVKDPPRSISHDARGNLTGDGVNGFTYNSVNQLMVHSGGGIINTLYYEPSSGMLSSINANAGPNMIDTRFAWSGPDLLLERSGSSGTILRRYVHGAGSDNPIMWYEGSTLTDRRFLMADERGSIVSVTDSADSTIAINSYDEYGIPAPTNVGRFGYTGQIWLPELKLWYYKARIYSPTLGRFLQTDPIGYKDGINWYAYVGGDPVNNTDPTGEELLGAVIGAATGAGLDYGVQVLGNLAEGKDLGDSLTDIDGGSILISAAGGAIAGATGVGTGAIIKKGVEAERLAIRAAKAVARAREGVGGTRRAMRTTAQARRAQQAARSSTSSVRRAVAGAAAIKAGQQAAKQAEPKKDEPPKPPEPPKRDDDRRMQ